MHGTFFTTGDQMPDSISVIEFLLKIMRNNPFIVIHVLLQEMFRSVVIQKYIMGIEIAAKR